MVMPNTEPIIRKKMVLALVVAVSAAAPSAWLTQIALPVPFSDCRILVPSTGREKVSRVMPIGPVVRSGIPGRRPMGPPPMPGRPGGPPTIGRLAPSFVVDATPILKAQTCALRRPTLKIGEGGTSAARMRSATDYLSLRVQSGGLKPRSYSVTVTTHPYLRAGMAPGRMMTQAARS